MKCKLCDAEFTPTRDNQIYCHEHRTQGSRRKRSDHECNTPGCTTIIPAAKKYCETCKEQRDKAARDRYRSTPLGREAELRCREKEKSPRIKVLERVKPTLSAEVAELMDREQARINMEIDKRMYARCGIKKDLGRVLPKEEVAALVASGAITHISKIPAERFQMESFG